MKNTIQHALNAAMILGVFSIVGMGLVSLIFNATEAKIADNERQALLNSLTEIIPADRYDNDIINDTIQVTDNNLGGAQKITIYRARKAGKPAAAVLTAIAPDGYNGAIKLLVAINEDQSLAGVRVVAHKETPGLGDNVETSRSDWIYAFQGKSLVQPGQKNWAVKRDGGVFDQFTGATITPRAIVKAVKNTLVYYQSHAEKIYAAPQQLTKQAD